MRKIAVCFILLFLVLLSASCGFTGKKFSKPKAGEAVVLPDLSANNSMNANARNIVASTNAYQQNVTNRLYEGMGTDQKCIDFDVDEKKIYVLERKEGPGSGAESGNRVGVYDIESGNLVSEINLDHNTQCNALAVRNQAIYLYDYASGDILKYSPNGKLKGRLATKMPHLKADKMEVAVPGKQFVILGTSSGEDGIYLLNPISHQKRKITESNLLPVLKYAKGFNGSSIEDFCSVNEHSVMIKVFPERICLYDLDRNKGLKASYIPDSAKLIEFGSGILYSVSVPKVALYTNQIANLSSEGGGNAVGRLIIGADFSWSTDSASLNDFQLGDIGIPFAQSGLNHFKMRENNKYLFFLDRGNTDKAEETSIYRIAK